MINVIHTCALGLLIGLGTLFTGMGLAANQTYSGSWSTYPPNIGYACPMVCCEDESYFEGYIQGLLNSFFGEYKITATVNNGCVYLSHYPCDSYVLERIVQMVSDVPGVKKVILTKCAIPGYAGPEERRIQRRQNCLEGMWLPPYGSLFQPLIADPRQVMNYVALRMGDETFGPQLAAVAYGAEVPIYRWFDVWKRGGMLQIGAEGGIWAEFKLNTPSMDLQDADYMLSFPLTYSYDDWSYRLRLYHISTHLGDEFLLYEKHPDLVRTNPSFEVLDFFSSFQWTNNIRVYGGLGLVLDSDKTFDQGRFYVAYGFEVRVLSGISKCYKLYWEPVLAVYVANRQFQNWDFDLTAFAGLEVGRIDFIGSKLRLGLQFHDGFSTDGQFQKQRTNWYEIRLAFSF